MPALCVFCGSSPGARPEYLELARAFGREAARRRVTIVYGGARVGLMGAMADAALAAGGDVIGVIPRSLVAREIAHEELTVLHVVDSMHERKATMARLADAFVALPGGIGTLEELFEVWTWLHLGVHDKPCAVLDTAGFWAPLLAFVDHMVAEGFLRHDIRARLLVAADTGELFEKLAEQHPSPEVRWIGPEET